MIKYDDKKQPVIGGAAHLTLRHKKIKKTTNCFILFHGVK